MTDTQPPTLTPGATSGDIDDDLNHSGAPPASAEDRKAAAALSSLDAPHDDSGAGAGREVDAEAVRKAMDRLTGVGAAGKAAAAAGGKKGEEGKGEGTKKTVKVEAEDVKMLIAECEVSKAKATEMLKASEGDAVRAMRTFVTA